MQRTYLSLALIGLLTGACGDDSAQTTGGTATTATASDTAGATTTTGTTDPTTGGSTTATASDSASDTATATTTSASSATTVGTDPTMTVTSEPPGTDSATTTSPGTTTEPGTTTTTTGETEGTTGTLDMCGVEGPDFTADLVQMKMPAPPCGPLEFTGTRISGEKGPVYQLDGCECGANCLIPDPWTLTVTAPAQWLPLMPACPRIVVDRQMGFGGCEFAAISVWDLGDPGAPAVYHGGRGFAPTQAGAGELTITEHSLGTCECEFCCNPSELWDLEFSFDGNDVTLGEGESAKLGGHDAINLESHHVGVCDAPLDVAWVVRKPA